MQGKRMPRMQQLSPAAAGEPPTRFLMCLSRQTAMRMPTPGSSWPCRPPDCSSSRNSLLPRLLRRPGPP